MKKKKTFCKDHVWIDISSYPCDYCKKEKINKVASNLLEDEKNINLYQDFVVRDLIVMNNFLYEKIKELESKINDLEQSKLSYDVIKNICSKY